MASAISASTPVQEIRLSFDPILSQVTILSWRTDEDPPVSRFRKTRNGAIPTKAQTIMIR